MTNIKDYLNLMRIRQWYKNALVFIALLYSGNLFHLDLLWITVSAFFSFALLSSAGYIVNDLHDRKRDMLNPEKRLRPLVTGKISILIAVIFSLVLILAGFCIAVILGTPFTLLAILFFTLSLLYTFVLKKIVFADVITIATLFVIRAVAGAIAIGVIISPWLILCPFFLSIFLTVGKRHGEIIFLKEKAAVARETLSEYNPLLTSSLMTISTTLFILSYALYSFLSPYNNLLLTLPFALFVTFRFYYFISNGSTFARHPEKIIHDTPMVIGLIIWLLFTIILLYR